MVEDVGRIIENQQILEDAVQEVLCCIDEEDYVPNDFELSFPVIWEKWEEVQCLI
ncbi:MAG: hypothetical protein SVO01_00455 [Thermotogota bacterium]|nr:hypothetical protein [Thermotogota bacterium]